MARNSNGTKQDDPLEVMDELADEMETAPDDWEVISEVTENHWHLPKGTSLEADATGKLRAVSIPDAEEVTRNENPKPDSRLPERLGGIATQLIAAVDKPPRLGALALLVALAAFAAWLRWGR